MKKILIIREVLNGLTRLVKAISCKISCCCKSECNTQRRNSSTNNELNSQNLRKLETITEV